MHPIIEDALRLVGDEVAQYAEPKSGYYQISMHPEDREKTAFITPLRFFKFNRVPKGLSGALATFQQLMQNTVEDLNLNGVLVYLDNIIVFSRTLEEH